MPISMANTIAIKIINKNINVTSPLFSLKFLNS